MTKLKEIYEMSFMPEYISKTHFKNSNNNIKFLGAKIIDNVFFAVVEEQEKEEIADIWEDFI